MRVSRRRTSSDKRTRILLAAGMLAVAVAIAAVALGPLAAEGQTRDVLRSVDMGRNWSSLRATSPLSEYRTHFTDETA